MYDNLWTVIIGLGIGTYLIRFSFLGIIGARPLPAWLMRHLRYTPVAVLPGLVAPLVLWPEATGGSPDLPRLAAAAAALGVGAVTRNVLGGIVAGAVVFYSLTAVAGV